MTLSRNRVVALTGLLLLLCLVLTYSNHFRNGFYFDDSHTIVSNSYITDLGNWRSFFTDAATFSSLPANQAYRPIVTLLNAIDYAMAGRLEPFYFHLSIFIAYLLQLVVMFLVLKRIFDLAHQHEWNAIFALGTVAFYGFHAASAETINYIIARSDSFSTLCIVASLLLFQVRATRRLHLYLVTMVLGILTKQTGLMFVPLLFLYIWLSAESRSDDDAEPLPWRAGLRRALLGTAPALVIGTLLFLFNQLYMTPASTVSANTLVSRWDYLATQFFVVVHYLGNFILPLRLSADPDFVVITSWVDWRVIGGLAVIVGLLVIAMLTCRRRGTRPIAFGILWFLIALLPTSSIVPLFQIANDHRTFFPYVGLVMSLGWAFALLTIRCQGVIATRPAFRTGLLLLVLLVIAGHAHGTRQRNVVWGSAESLWLDVTRKSPGNGRGLMNYGLTQMNQGRYEVALDYYQRALELMPRYSYLHVNLGIVTNAMGQPAVAEQYFKQAQRYGAENPEVNYFYARWLDAQGRRREAISLLESGLVLSPGHVRIEELLAILRRQEAAAMEPEIERLRRLLREQPMPGTYLDLSLAYYRAGDFQACIAACRQALELRPDYALAYNNICSAYNQLGEWDAAILACEQALAIDPELARARGNLEWAEERKSRR